jgi:hypothetical protein
MDLMKTFFRVFGQSRRFIHAVRFFLSLPIQCLTLNDLLGGIITLSPSAMFHHPIEMLHKIRQINAHSLWECYILPSALGMLAKMVCGDDDPLAVLER